MRSKKNQFKALSKRARTLLESEENYDVEYKRSLSDLDNSDLVAFANSESGGAILIGIEERKMPSGRKMGYIVGCPIGDDQKLKILSKSQSCDPLVNVEIFVENTNSKPFYRIEIASGKNKPYCTSGGTYKIRADGNSIPIKPKELLSIFIESETQQFLKRFKDATKELEDSLADISNKVSEMEGDIESSLNSTFDSAESARDFSDDAMSFSDETLGTVNEVNRQVENIDDSIFDINRKIDALLNHFGIEDPLITSLRRMAKNWVEKSYKDNKQINRKEIFKTLNEIFPRASKDQLKQWYKEKIDELKSRETTK